MNFSCFECNAEAQFSHHVVPQSRGGTRALPLCAKCHGLVHNRFFRSDHSQLVIDGLKAAKARGSKLGRPRREKIDPSLLNHPNETLREAAKRLGVSKSTVKRWIKLI